MRGRHIFNPSNFGLVLCFLLLGASRADPLALWWGPLSPSLVFALVLIVVGGFLILRRLHLVGVAVGFWVAFAAGIALLAASGHTMTAPWHVGPIEGREFWWLLVTSPEILVFLFFMITDPKTIPASRTGRRVYAVSVGLLATVLIAPQTTEFATKVAILGALFAVCATRGVIELVGAERLASLVPRMPRRPVVGSVALAGALVYAGLVVAAGVPARPEEGSAAARDGVQALPAIDVVNTPGIATIDEGTAQTIARDIVVDLRTELQALRARNEDLAAEAATGTWLAALWNGMRTAETITAGQYDVDRMQLQLRRSDGQAAPHVVARLEGTQTTSAFAGSGTTQVAATAPQPFTRTLMLVLEGGSYRIAQSEGGVPLGGARGGPAAPAGDLGGTTFHDVAHSVGLDFRQGAFRFGMSFDTTAMMGGGLCWLDYDEDGWIDLFVVNSHADIDIAPSDANGGLPRSALYHNVGGRFENVSERSGADLPLRGNGCVAADFDLDGHTDLYVTSAGYNVPTDGWDALLWNNGDGTFTEGAVAAGIKAPGWHSAAAAGDVNGDGRPDLFVSSYTDPNVVVDAAAGFPSDHAPVRDLLYLNQGPDERGHVTFREVARAAGIEKTAVGHGLGAVLTDVDGDGRLDLYVANDADPNQLYRNIPDRGSELGFRFDDVAKRLRVDDPNAGMGIAAADYSGDGQVDLFVTNSRHQLHAAFRSPRIGARYVDARPDIAAVIGTDSTGWGSAWADLDLDGDLDLVLANGAIPVVNLAKDARRVQVLENVAGPGRAPRFALVKGAGLARSPEVNGRGLATADFDNDGDLDVAVNTIGGKLVLLRNDAPRRHWLEVRLRSFAPGTLVTATLGDGRELVREIQAGSSYLSSEDPRVHFGLGKAASVARLTIRYPDGRTKHLEQVAADQIVDVG